MTQDTEHSAEYAVILEYRSHKGRVHIQRVVRAKSWYMAVMLVMPDNSHVLEVTLAQARLVEEDQNNETESQNPKVTAA